MAKIKELENKMEFNKNLLIETIQNVCKDTEFKATTVFMTIDQRKFDLIKVDDPNDKTYLKLSMINNEYHKIQDNLQVKIHFEKAENTQKKIGYDIFEDITKKDIDLADENVINQIKDYSNEALFKLYELRKLDKKYLEYDSNGLLTKANNGHSLIEKISFDKNLTYKIEKIDSGRNTEFDKLTKSDLLVIWKINNEYNTNLEFHFSKTKELNELNSSTKNHFVGFSK